MSDLRRVIKAEFDAVEALLRLLPHQHPDLRENKHFCALIGLCAQEPDHLLRRMAEVVEGIPMPIANFPINISGGDWAVCKRHIVEQLERR